MVSGADDREKGVRWGGMKEPNRGRDEREGRTNT
jgi:hypothetical protein